MRIKRLFGLSLGVGLGLCAAVASAWLPSGPHDIDLTMRLDGPSAVHWLGTDHLGRDLAARVLAGAGPSMMAVILVLVGSLSFGVLAAAGIMLGPAVLASGLRWLAQLCLTLPTIVVALLLAAMLGPGPLTLAIALVATSWATYAVTISTLFERISGEEYWRASLALGVDPGGALRRHLLPNALPAISALAGADAGRAIILAASLGFLGLSADTGRPEWGAMIHEYRLFLFSEPRLILAPLLAVSALSLALHLAIDPD